MKLQKLKLAITPVVAMCKPELLAYLTTLDHYCVPIKDGQKEEGPKCELYFQKKYNKKKLRELNEYPWPKGLYVRFCNTYDNPCFIQDGHDSEYAVWLYEIKDIKDILVKTIKMLNA